MPSAFVTTDGVQLLLPCLLDRRLRREDQHDERDVVSILVMAGREAENMQLILGNNVIEANEKIVAVSEVDNRCTKSHLDSHFAVTSVNSKDSVRTIEVSDVTVQNGRLETNLGDDGGILWINDHKNKTPPKDPTQPQPESNICGRSIGKLATVRWHIQSAVLKDTRRFFSTFRSTQSSSTWVDGEVVKKRKRRNSRAKLFVCRRNSRSRV